jgi:hypothetical protein
VASFKWPSGAALFRVYGPFGPIFPRYLRTQAPQVFEQGSFSCPLTTSSLHLPRYSLYIVFPAYVLPSYQMFSLSHYVSRLRGTPFFCKLRSAFPCLDRCANCLICLCMSCAHGYRSVSHESYRVQAIQTDRVAPNNSLYPPCFLDSVLSSQETAYTLPLKSQLPDWTSL